MNYYDEKEHRNGLAWPYLEKIILLLLVILLCASGLTVCAPAVVKEDDHQKQRLGQALYNEAHYRAHEQLKDCER